VFGQGRRERIGVLTELYPHIIHAGNFDEHAAALADTEVIFATWGMMNFNAAQRATTTETESGVLRRRQCEGMSRQA